MDDRTAKKTRWTWRRAAYSTIGGYAIAILSVMSLENFLVYPAPRYPDGEWDTSAFACEDVFFTATDGTRLHGWYFAHPAARGNLLFCHGNGEHLGFLGGELAALRDALRLNVFAFDYRGYGRSSGSPYEAGLIADGDAAQRWLAQRAGVPPDQIIVMGRSLGGGVAVDLAIRHGARGLILWNAFSSLPDVAARLFPWLPVRWLMRNRFDSLTKIARYRGAILQSHGTADHIVPFELAEKLFAAATSSEKQFVAIPGGGHNDPAAPEFAAELAKWIDRLSPA